MRGFDSAVLALVVFTCGFPGKAAQDSHDFRPGADLKQISTTLPESSDAIRMTALSIDRDWTTSMVHLKGSVRVDMQQFSRSGHRLLVIRADEADYNGKTGELVPRGNVRITQEEIK